MGTSARFRSRRSDQYYWITSVLAARDLQRSTCRLIAATIFGLGVIPSILAFDPTGANQAASVVGAVITVCSIAMASRWLRRSWPSRFESQLCAVLGTLCVCAACVIERNPVIGLLGSTGFAVLSGFVAFFHTRRLLMFCWLVAAATLAVLAIRLVAIDMALAVCAVILVALVNVFVAFTTRAVIGLIDTEVNYGEIEPLTGLLNRAAFYERIATVLGARTRDDDRHLIVVVANLDSFSLLTAIAGVSGGDRARIAIAQRLRETVRRETIVAHVNESEFLIADLFTTVDPSPLAERIRRAIATSPFRLTASIGAVSTPLRPLAGHLPYETLDEILNIATTAMYEARKMGGNKVCKVLGPRLTKLDDPDGEWNAGHEWTA